jgi:ATP-dependent DNA helicase RecG
VSRLRVAAQAIAAPLAFASRAADARERIRDLRETLLAALARAAALAIPPEAKSAFEGAAKLLEAEPALDVALPRVEKRVAPYLRPEWPLAALALPAERVPGVGPRIAAALARKEIHTVEDLLFFLPRSYEDRRWLVPIEALQVGRPACFQAHVIRAGVVPLARGRRFFEAVVSDATGAVQLKWFRGIASFAERLRPGARVLVSGDVRRYRFAKELHHPDVEVLAEDAPLESLPRIVPVYSAVEGVPPRSVLRLVASAVEHYADLVDSWLPESFAGEHELPEIGDSLRQVHQPQPHLDPDRLRARATPYHRRMVAEELFLLQAGLRMRQGRLARRSALPLAPDAEAVRRVLGALPFELTEDQRVAWREIRGDLLRPHPMNRLLIGDVGTGKTVLALLAAAAAHAAGALAAVLAPTELLAEQHGETFARLGAPGGLRTALLTGSTPAPARRELLRALGAGEVSVLVGTHALLGEAIELPQLRLVVIDEQHRFGVAQRQLLRRKAEAPHVLVMTATPIPRTLALTVYGDLEQSRLRQRPAGRAPVVTRVVPPDAARGVLGEIRTTLARGEQVYVVYPLVEESEKQDLLDATRGFERLSRALPGVSIALLHGRLDPRDRSRTIARFRSGQVRLLVATTVIEVGVDVPGATLLVVQHAERMGLAQLHQLRGRVGRGERPGTAVLIADPKGEDAARRLAVLEASDSGFEIAEEDLRIRGPGEWLGTRQAGHLPELRIADLVRHAELLGPAREAADRLLGRDPELLRHRALAAAIERRWGRRLELGWES